MISYKTDLSNSNYTNFLVVPHREGRGVAVGGWSLVRENLIR